MGSEVHSLSRNVFPEILDIDFSQIPSQSKIFLEYQKEPTNLKKFYPLAVSSHTGVLDNLRLILKNYQVDREKLCQALLRINLSYGASEKTLSNIELLHHSDCVAIVTGQQAGLFTGPLYCIYKTLTAIKLAECLQMRGVKAVPVFWIATEDHDFAEVASCFVVDKRGKVVQIKSEPRNCYDGLPVGLIRLDDSIKETTNGLFQALVRTGFSDDLKNIIEESWQPGFFYGEAFARMMTKLFSKYGLILLCPLDKDLKRLASPIYFKAADRADKIVKSLLLCSEELVISGFHAQVSISETYFPLFWHSKDGKRHALKKIGQDLYRTKDGEREFRKNELLELIKVEPESFSPSVVLRPVVQDFLLPTLCYFGGASEIAYFAQSAEVYRVLERPVTPIIHRQSFTIIPNKQAKIMKKYGLSFDKLLAGKDTVFSSLIETQIYPEARFLFTEVEEKINVQLDRLERYFSQIDPTLVESLARRRKKIIYHVNALKSKFLLVQKRKNEVLNRHLEILFSVVFPFEHLQERTLNISFFLNLYGEEFIDKIYSILELDDRKHKVFFY